MKHEPSVAGLSRLERRHLAWLKALELARRPWLILGSAPAPALPPALLATHARVDINNAGRTAAALGLGRADLTVRAKRKSWDEHPHTDTRGLLWMHEAPGPVLRLMLRFKPHDHVGRVIGLPRAARDRIVAGVSGVSLEGTGLGKVTNGVAAACYALRLGVPAVVLAGISLSASGHSYDGLNRTRRQVDEDALVLDSLRRRSDVFTTERELARLTGLRLLEA